MKLKEFPKKVLISGRVGVCVDLVKKQNVRGKVVVDVGSSFGWLDKEIIKLGAGKVIGIEPDVSAVAFAKKDVSRGEFFVGSALNLPVGNNIADLVTFFDVIEHVPPGTEMQALSEISRILKPRGALLLSTPNSNAFSNLFDVAWYFGHRHYSPDHVRTLLERSGFKIEILEVKGSVLSSLYLTWFYIAKRIAGKSQPRNKFLENLDDRGYKGRGLTDIFVVAKKI